MKSQTDEILAHLRAGNKITPSYAITHFRCYRLAARIHEIAERGYPVLSTMKSFRSKRTGRITRYAEYSLETNRKQHEI